MRWAVVQDSDGSSEYQKVILEPRNWFVYLSPVGTSTC